MLVNKYESRNVQQTRDDWMDLCTLCAADYANQVRFMEHGDSTSECEFCGAANDEVRKARLDREYAAFQGR